MTPDEFQALVVTLERRPDLQGRRVADIPELAVMRLKFRRRWYRLAEANFAAAIFNLVIATSPLIGSLWVMNVGAAALSVTTMFFAEGHARTLTRQLHRPAALQLARDIAGVDE